MNMTVTNASLAIIVTIALFIFGGLFSLIFFLLKRTITDKIDEVSKIIKGVQSQLGELKIEIAKEYVRRDEFDDNIDAHKELWEALNNIRERIKGAETNITNIEKNQNKGDSQ